MSDDAPKEPEFSVTIKGNGIDINRKVPELVVRQLVNVLLSPQSQHGITVAVPTGTMGVTGYAPQVTVSGPAERVSLAEYLDGVSARKIPEKIVAMAYYLTVVTKQIPSQIVSRADIKPAFRMASEPEPANFARDFATAVALGWLAPEASDPNLFFITRTGRSAIEQKFSADAKRIVRSRRRRARAENDAAVPEAEEGGEPNGS